MKTKFYIKTSLSLMVVALLSSCLKDSQYAVDFTTTKALVELPGSTSTGSSGTPLQVTGLTISSTPVPLNVAVNLAAPKPLSSALNVTLAVNTDTLTKYNAANGTSYVLLPAADYTTSFSTTIPAGQHLANVVININTSLIDPTQQYALPISIKSGGGQQISNWNTIIYAFTLKNQYDGSYTATGYVFHPSSPRAIKATYTLSTVNGNTLEAPLADLGASDQFEFSVAPPVNGVSALTDWVALGSTPQPPSSGFMTADNPAGVPYAASPDGLPGGATYNSSTYNNTYVVATKTFWMHFGYQVGSSGQSGYTRQFYMKLVAQ